MGCVRIVVRGASGARPLKFATSALRITFLILNASRSVLMVTMAKSTVVFVVILAVRSVLVLGHKGVAKSALFAIFTLVKSRPALVGICVSLALTPVILRDGVLNAVSLVHLALFKPISSLWKIRSIVIIV